MPRGLDVLVCCPEVQPVKQFSVPSQSIGDIDFETASVLITAASDVALVVASGKEALISDVAFGDEEVAGALGDVLRGRSWLETVTVESRPKVQALLTDAAAGATPRWRQVNHPLSEGNDLPVMYAAIQMAGNGSILAVGRSLKPMARLQQQLVETQQSMEREYLRLRQAETRHRLLFQLSSEAVLIVDAASRKIVDANPAATRLLGDAGRRLVGRELIDAFDVPSRQAIAGLLGAVQATGRVQDIPVRSNLTRARDLFISASLFREGKSSYFLIRLMPAQAAAAPRAEKSKVLEVVENSPDGFVVTDLGGKIMFANRSFLDTAQLATADQAREQPLGRWVGRPGIDSELLLSQLTEHGSVRRFATIVRGELGSETEVEIGAVAVLDGEEPCHGLTIREVTQVKPRERSEPVEKPKSVEQLTELVGRVPLKDLVRESTDMIEKLCIEAALELSGDNRASAAEMLGLSRQSLYAKLRRYGLGDLDPSGEDADPSP